MFAVKGWSVDAATLKRQTEPFKTAKAKSSTQQGEQNPNRKRKRGEGQVQPPSNEDVGKLWDEHIEGKKSARSKTATKKEQKKQKLEKTESDAAPQEDGAAKAKHKQEQEGREGEESAKHKKKSKKNQSQGGESKKPATNGQALKKQAASAPPAVPPLPATAKLTPMQSAMRQKLVSARFRHLNQTLYTAPSETALDLFDHNPEMFEDYHSGFRQQVAVWPENPVDNFIMTIRERGKVKSPRYKDKKSKGEPAADQAGTLAPLPRTQGTSIIADLGCGDARLAQTLTSSNDISKFNLKIHSYDLHSPSKHVTKADISNLPLPDGSADVAIFCLALMGTNWISFIEEAYRALHWKGELWIAEIKSRFGRVGKVGKPVEHSVGSKKKQVAAKKAQETKQKEDEEVDEHTALRTEVDGVETKQEETDVSAFVDVLRRRGFLLKDGDRSVDLSNKMFVKMEFIKAAPPTKGKGAPAEGDKPAGKQGFGKKKFVDETKDDVVTDDEAKVLKPCLYKLR
ncbi:hypothetical protein B0A50_02119 [Salinomyces thailandicus]|uniref:Ribosomal RNA-processing protein 8 n=1 Tax=Salinomyces thailandicus TaxID=706561 RepID=A0A4U0U869_9PEZI|nr:hypothetical protein B0A50_02119 [Salinomyces thailandica]